MSKRVLVVIVAVFAGLAVLGGAIWIAVTLVSAPPAPLRPGQESPPPPEPQDTPTTQPVPPVGEQGEPPGRRKPAPEDIAAGVRFEFEGFETGLREVDWRKMAVLLHELEVLVDQLGLDLVRGTHDLLEVSLQVDARFSALATQCAGLRRYFGGAEEMSVFTHPAFAANAIAVTLEAAGEPLSSTQLEGLEEIGRLAAAKERVRMEKASLEPFLLRRQADEITARLPFYEAVRDLLDRSQNLALGQGDLRDSVGLDLFSPGIVWRLMPHPLGCNDLEMIATEVMSATDGVVVDTDNPMELFEVAKKWVGTLPPKRLRFRPGAASIAGYPPLDRTLAASRDTVALLEILLEEFEPSASHQVMAHTFRHPLVPMKIE